jgi:hypothetical protein
MHAERRTLTPMTEQSYVGGCHCGQVRFETKVDLSAPVVACNCSICSRMGWLLSFVPATEFKLLSGEDALTDYQFNKKRIHHVFCSRCGIHSFSRGVGQGGAETRAINVRCLEGVDPDELKVKRFDGKSI